MGLVRMCVCVYTPYVCGVCIVSAIPFCLHRTRIIHNVSRPSNDHHGSTPRVSPARHLYSNGFTGNLPLAHVPATPTHSDTYTPCIYTLFFGKSTPPNYQLYIMYTEPYRYSQLPLLLLPSDSADIHIITCARYTQRVSAILMMYLPVPFN